MLCKVLIYLYDFIGFSFFGWHKCGVLKPVLFEGDFPVPKCVFLLYLTLLVDHFIHLWNIISQFQTSNYLFIQGSFVLFSFLL